MATLYVKDKTHAALKKIAKERGERLGELGEGIVFWWIIEQHKRSGQANVKGRK